MLRNRETKTSSLSVAHTHRGVKVRCQQPHQRQGEVLKMLASQQACPRFVHLSPQGGLVRVCMPCNERAQ